jgi:hypothetical protein
VKAAHTAEENWGPRSDVITAGKPNLDIQLPTKAAAQSSAVVDLSGAASHHRVERSIMVKRWVNPSEEAGRGPTKSMCRCKKRRSGTAMGCTAALNCFVTFAAEQSWHSLHHFLTSAAKPGHK